MPTLAMQRFHPPKSWEEFQEMARDALALRWSSPNLQLNGRKGQKQHGVDIFGEDDLGRFVGVECKNYELQISKSLVIEGIEEAESFTPQLKSYFFATSTPRDANLQKEIRLISEERLKKNKFPVGILFWDDLLGNLASDIQIVKKHYPQNVDNSENKSIAQRMLCLFELSYFGNFVSEYVSLIFGEIGWMLEKPEEISKLTNGLKRYSSVLFDSQTNVEMSNLCDNLLKKCKATASGEIDSRIGWAEVDGLVIEIESIVKSYESILYGDELSVFILGRNLGMWELVLEPKLKALETKSADQISRGIRVAIKDKESLNNSLKILKKNTGKVKDSIKSVPRELFVAVRRALQDQAAEQ